MKLGLAAPPFTPIPYALSTWLEDAAVPKLGIGSIIDGAYAECLDSDAVLSIGDTAGVSTRDRLLWLCGVGQSSSLLTALI